jgi:hypothetical protein
VDEARDQPLPGSFPKKNPGYEVAFVNGPLVKREVGSDFSGYQGLARKVMIMNYIYIAHFSYGYVRVGFA